jgi:hypothetical protein
LEAADEGLNAEIKAHTKTKTDLTNRVRALTNDKTNLETTVGSYKAEIADLNGKVADFKTTVETMTGTESILEEALVLAEEEHQELEASRDHYHALYQQTLMQLARERRGGKKRGGPLTTPRNKRKWSAVEYTRELQTAGRKLKISQEAAKTNEAGWRGECDAHAATQWDLQITDEVVMAGFDTVKGLLKGNDWFAKVAVYGQYRSDLLEDLNDPKKGVHKDVSHCLVEFFMPAGNRPVGLTPRKRWSALEREYERVAGLVNAQAAYGTEAAFQEAFLQYLINHA